MSDERQQAGEQSDEELAQDEVWGPKPPDTVTPHQQSLVVIQSLSRSQFEAYRTSSGLPEESTPEEVALHFAEHRVGALQEAAAFRERVQKWRRTRAARSKAGRRKPAPRLPEEAAAELASAQEVSDAAGRVWQTLSMWSGIAGLAVGWGFLITGILGLVPGLQFLFLVSAACMVVSSLLMFVISPALYARGQKASRAALLEWAVHRPGQLERGLPGLHRRVDEDAMTGGSFCLGLVTFGIGGFCGLLGLVMIPIAIFDAKLVTWQITGILLGIAAVLLLTPWLVRTWNRWVMRRNDEMDEAVGWVYAAAVPGSRLE